jgi:hypothetical protein
MSQHKIETAIRRLDIALKKRVKDEYINMPWEEMDRLLNSAQTIEMNNIIGAYNDGYKDCESGLPNQTEQDDSNINL